MKDKILTIDVGTGSTRAAILRIDGAMIGFAQREYEQTTPVRDGQNRPVFMVAGRLRLYTRGALSLSRNGSADCGYWRLRTNARHRPAGRAGELVEDRALLWNDKRSQPQVDAFIAREGREKWLAHLNNPPAAAWPAFKLVWWREHHPERWPQLAKVLMPKDYINFMLTGAMATDYSEASCYF
jgi:sugar (pentulose or hexulose) kinase